MLKNRLACQALIMAHCRGAGAFPVLNEFDSR